MKLTTAEAVTYARLAAKLAAPEPKAKPATAKKKPVKAKLKKTATPKKPSAK